MVSKTVTFALKGVVKDTEPVTHFERSCVSSNPNAHQVAYRHFVANCNIRGLRCPLRGDGLTELIADNDQLTEDIVQDILGAVDNALEQI